VDSAWYHQTYRVLAQKGMRVLALAFKRIDVAEVGAHARGSRALGVR
jgi:hypothetical protein